MTVYFCFCHFLIHYISIGGEGIIFVTHRKSLPTPTVLLRIIQQKLIVRDTIMLLFSKISLYVNKIKLVVQSIIQSDLTNFNTLVFFFLLSKAIVVSLTIKSIKWVRVLYFYYIGIIKYFVTSWKYTDKNVSKYPV